MVKLTLKEMREDNDLTQRDIANHFNVHINTVKNWEKDDNYKILNLRKLLPLLEFYGYNLNDLDM